MLQTYIDTNGKERSAMQVTITDIEFLSEKRSPSTEPQQSQASQPQTQTAAAVDQEDELPF